MIGKGGNIERNVKMERWSLKKLKTVGTYVNEVIKRVFRDKWRTKRSLIRNLKVRFEQLKAIIWNRIYKERIDKSKWSNERIIVMRNR